MITLVPTLNPIPNPNHDPNPNPNPNPNHNPNHNPNPNPNPNHTFPAGSSSVRCWCCGAVPQRLSSLCIKQGRRGPQHNTPANWPRLTKADRGARPPCAGCSGGSLVPHDSRAYAESKAGVAGQPQQHICQPRLRRYPHPQPAQPSERPQPGVGGGRTGLVPHDSPASS